MSLETPSIHGEMHYVHRIGWLRAAVLGANDGIVSVASVLVGVAAAGSPHNTVILSGLAALVAGAMSMAAGEYVSVSSQADTEQADLAREKSELETHWDDELEELTTIYERRGLDPQLAHQVARQVMEKDALGAHAREERGITEVSASNPLQAAWTSGAALPQIAAWLTSGWTTVWTVAGVSLLILIVLGALGAQTGGASLWKGAARVAFWGALALAVTYAVGALFGTITG